jgi:predicted AAA+ superfamily ATPase
LISNICGELSVKKLAKRLGMHVHTLNRWVNALDKSFLLFFIEKYEIKLRERLKPKKKVFVIDNGIFYSASYRFSENKGRLMENLVAIELLRRKSYFRKQMEIYYYKDYNGREIDFIVKEGLKVKQLIQVTYSSSFDDIKDREWKNLLLAYEYLKEYNQNPELIVITWDYEDIKELSWYGHKGRIKFVPLWRWLLEI